MVPPWKSSRNGINRFQGRGNCCKVIWADCLGRLFGKGDVGKGRRWGILSAATVGGEGIVPSTCWTNVISLLYSLRLIISKIGVFEKLRKQHLPESISEANLLTTELAFVVENTRRMGVKRGGRLRGRTGGEQQLGNHDPVS